MVIWGWMEWTCNGEQHRYTLDKLGNSTSTLPLFTTVFSNLHGFRRNRSRIRKLYLPTRQLWRREPHDASSDGRHRLHPCNDKWKDRCVRPLRRYDPYQYENHRPERKFALSYVQWLR